MAFDILNGFLDTEIKSVNSPEYHEMYSAIVYFLTSFEIREGVFEANEYVLRKVNRETVFVFQEYETADGTIYSKDARIISTDLLLKNIYHMAGSMGLDTPND